MLHEPGSPSSRWRFGTTALLVVVMVTVVAGEAVAAPLAFPGAEGFAALVAGGRKGQVVHVTTLADSGAGSLRDAVSGSNRIVVFDASGVIRLAAVLVVGGDNITLAGQSAPGDGITIYGHETSFSSRSNIIVRYLRFRQGMIDASGSAQKTVNITDGQNMIFDHVSIQWGRWDNFGITGTSSTVTLQSSIVGEGVPPQNFGSIIDGEQDITIAHNLWIDNNERNPKFKANGECINNVVYDWGSGGGIIGGHSGADWYEDYIGNYLIAGPSAVANFFTFYTSTDHAYQVGNMVDVNRNGQLDGRAVVDADFAGTTPPTFETAAHSKPPVAVTVLSAEAAYARVMAEAGTCLHRDAVESRLIGQLGSLGTKGAIIADESNVGGQPAMTQVTRPAGFDTDGDGMPDAWETAHGLDPSSASDGNGDRDGDGYTNVEEYLNELADLACPGGTTLPPDTADAGAPGPVDAAVPPVDARDAPGSGGITGTGGAGAASSGTGGAVSTAAPGGGPGSGGGPGTGGRSASGGGTSPGAVGAGGSASTGGAPGDGAAQAGNSGCSCRISPVGTRSYPALALLGFVVLALRVRKRPSMNDRSRGVSISCKSLSGTERPSRRPRERTTTMFTIDSTIDIAAPLARVRTAITTEAGYRAWLAQDCDFDGQQATFRFSQPSEMRSVTLEVDRCDGGAIVMTCMAHQNNADWLGTTLAIDVSETPTGTRVHLAHSGYPAKNEVYERCSDAWPYFLRSLASYMMTGTGEPYPRAG